MPATVFKGNKREVPGDLPILLWRDKVLEYAALDLSYIPWHHEWMEYLSPSELQRLRSKALVWHEVTGTWPEEIVWWWEVRMARRRGDIPPTVEIAVARIDEQGVLHCGYCQARWSPDHDGTPHMDRCKLCDRIWIIVADERIEEHGFENQPA